MLSAIHKRPISICWDITQKCNEKCKFCYRANNCNDLCIEDNLMILQKLISSGVKKISFVGGEPLLYNGILDIIKIAKRAGIITSLTTNGTLLSYKKLDELNNNIDWLTLPLDCNNDIIQTMMTRRSGHFYTVIELLNLIKSGKYSFKIKINSIATKINKDNLTNLIDIIKKYNVNRWKIFQFYPIRGEAIVNKNIFSISNGEFRELRRTISKKKYLITNCLISFSDIEELQKSYLSISPDGNARVSFGNNDIILGNMFGNELNELWKSSYIDKEKHFERNKWIIELMSMTDRHKISILKSDHCSSTPSYL